MKTTLSEKPCSSACGNGAHAREGDAGSRARWQRGLGEAVAYVYGATVLEQGCVFHKPRNVADKSREDLPDKEKKEARHRLAVVIDT